MKNQMGWIGAAVLLVSLSAWSDDNTNLLPTLSNGGFETPEITTGAKVGDEPAQWFFFSSDPSHKVGLTDARKRSGMQSLLFRAQATADAYEGFAQKFAATAGQRFTFTAWVLNDPQEPVAANSYGQLSLEWKDASGVEISRTYSAGWGASSSSDRWEKFSVSDVAPTNAAVGVAVVTFFGRDSAGIGGFFVDECELLRP